MSKQSLREKVEGAERRLESASTACVQKIDDLAAKVAKRNKLRRDLRQLRAARFAEGSGPARTESIRLLRNRLGSAEWMVIAARRTRRSAQDAERVAQKAWDAARRKLADH